MPREFESNPRTISDSEFQRLRDFVDKYGDLSGIVHDLNSDQIIGGNQRSKLVGLFDGDTKITVTEELDVPDSQGTVAWGYVLSPTGARLQYRAVRWTKAECREANIVANLVGGDWDWGVLAETFARDELTDLGFSQKETAAMFAPEPVAPADPVYNDEQILESAFQWFRKNGFPYRNVAPHVAMQEINALAASSDTLLHTNMCYHVADTYHPHRLRATAQNMTSPVDSFNMDKRLRRALKMQMDAGAVIPDTMFGYMLIVSGTQTVSNFRPGFACYLYRKYCPPGGVVLDTSMGYGGRLLGAVASRVVSLYIGTDPAQETYQGNVRMARELGFEDMTELYDLPAEDMSHDAVAGRVDMAFTSPPYFRKEHYSDEPTQSWKRYETGSEWRDGFLRPMIALQYAALKPGGYNIINIADVKIGSETYPLISWAMQAASDAGFAFVESLDLSMNNRVGRGHDGGYVAEPVLVFQRGASL